MAQVESKTSTKIDELLADVVVGAHVQDGFLLITTRDGAIFNAGAVASEDSGANWLTGLGVPDVALGQLGDFYLENSLGDYYEKTTLGWVLRGTLHTSAYIDTEPPVISAPEGHLWYDEDDNTSAPFSWNELVDKPVLNYTHTQAVAAAVWTINHNLNRYPQITVVDSGGSEVVGDITYINPNTIQATFGGAFGGKAYLT